MRVAKHPNKQGPITIGDYLKEFGRPSVDQRAPDNRQHAICPFCGAELVDRAAATKRSAHFAHRPNAQPCPSKEPAGKPFITLTPTDPDEEAGRRLKLAFGSHWQKHYRQLDRLVLCFAWQEFVALLERADDLRIWEYKGLQEDRLPYVLVLLADFPPWTGWKRNGEPQREFWLRFWYEASVRKLDQLWIEPRQKTQLFRISFKPPRSRKGRPKFETDLVDFSPIREPSHFLSEPDPQLRDFVVREVTGWMKGHGGFGL